MATNIPLLKAAIYLIKSGYKKEARPLLFNLLDHNPADEVAFLWYVDTIPDIRDRIHSLEDFLEEFPDSIYAKTGLKSLQDDYRLHGSADKPEKAPIEEQEIYTEAETDEQQYWMPEEKEDLPEVKVAEEPLTDEEDVEEIPTSVETEETSDVELYPLPAVEMESGEGIPTEETLDEGLRTIEPGMEPYEEEVIPDEQGSVPAELGEEKKQEKFLNVWEAYDAAGGEFSTADEIENWQVLPEDQGEEYRFSEIKAEQLVEEETAGEQEEAQHPPEEEDYVPDWLREAQLAEVEVEREGIGYEDDQKIEGDAFLGQDELDWLGEEAPENEVSQAEAEAEMIAASYSAPTKKPREVSPDEVVQQIRKAEEQLPQAEGIPQRDREKTQDPSKKKKVLRILEIIAILIVCCIGLAIIGYFARPLLFESAETKYAREMEPVLQNVNNWMNGPITDWNQIMDEQVYNNQSTTYRELLSEQMAIGSTDVVIKERLIPAAREIISDGAAILEDMDVVAEPTAIADAHQDVVDCVQYEIEYMANVVNLLQYNVPANIGESRCGNFTSAYDEVRQFVDSNK